MNETSDFSYLRDKLDAVAKTTGQFKHSGTERMIAALGVHYIDNGEGSEACSLVWQLAQRNTS